MGRHAVHCDTFSQFNAIVFGNVSTTLGVKGRIVVGGDFTGGATFNLNPAAVGASSFAARTVYGDATSGGTDNVNNLGGVTIAGNSNVFVNLNGGGQASAVRIPPSSR